MRLGIQENLLPGETFEEKVRKAEEYGFDCIELWGHNLEGRVKEIKDALRGRDLQISTICSGYRGSLLSSEKEQRDIAVKDIKKAPQDWGRSWGGWSYRDTHFWSITDPRFVTL